MVDLVGKGGHARTVPIPVWVKETFNILSPTANEAVKNLVMGASAVRESFGRLGFSFEKSGYGSVGSLSCFSRRREPLAACLGESVVAGCR
jgi:hypothetical protein